MTAKLCYAKGCHNLLKPPKKKFCSPTCSKSYHNAVYNAKQKGAVYEPDHDGKPVAQPALEAVVSKIMGLSEKYPKKKDEVLNKYKSQFGITSEKIGPADIRTAEQGHFLTLLILTCLFS